MNRKIIWILTFCFSLWMPGYAWAQPESFVPVADTSVVLKELTASIQQTKTIQSKFRQLKCLDVLEEEIESYGEFYYAREDKVRWEYMKPLTYLIVINGENIYIKSDDEVKTYSSGSNKFFEQMNRILIGSIQGEILRDQELFRILYYEDAGHYLAVLHPRKEAMQRMLDHVEMYFDKHDFSVSRLIFMEPAGDFTRIDFYDRIFNEHIPREVFTVD